MKLYASVDTDLKDFKSRVSTLLKLCDIGLSNDKISEYVNDFQKHLALVKNLFPEVYPIVMLWL